MTLYTSVSSNGSRPCARLDQSARQGEVVHPACFLALPEGGRDETVRLVSIRGCQKPSSKCTWVKGLPDSAALRSLSAASG